MRKLTKLEKFGLIAAIVVCGSYYYMNKIYDPEAKSLKKTVQQLNSAIKKYNATDEPPAVGPVRKRVERLKKELEKITAKLKEAGGRTGDPSEITGILAKITSLARQNQIMVVKMTPDREVRETLFNWAVFRAELTGGYHNFHQFIQDLEKMSQPVQMRNLNLTTKGESGLIAIDITLLI